MLNIDWNELPPETKIKQVAYDSRAVKPGGLFVAIPGFRYDGHEFIPDAIANGAAAVVLEQPTTRLPAGVAKVIVPDSREALPDIAANFYDYPSRKQKVVGVTGTNGKTSTTFLCEAMFQQAGYKTGLIGTIENHIGDRILPVERTTPESVDIEYLLGEMVKDGATHVVLEVSSHALDLKRVKNIDFDVAVFTNLSQDHLDYHKTLADYRLAKAQLFAQLSSKGRGKGVKTAVLNADDPNSAVMEKATAAAVLTYGIENKADITASQIKIEAQTASFRLTTPAGISQIRLNTTGLFSVYNALAACSVGISQGIGQDIISAALENMSGVPGRFEQVKCGQDFSVIVDYAHTPDGLENILKTAREFAAGRVILVFGCGGDRDRTKRPLMGRLGAKYADLVYITSDNPRSEDPEEIINHIEAGVKEVADKGSYNRIIDRRQAIYAALAAARPQDVVLIAGKGHETDQILNERTIHFDDREVVRDYFKGLNSS